MVEQGVAAYGASGRNAGMLSETVDHSHGLAIQHFGLDGGAAAGGAGRDATSPELIGVHRGAGHRLRLGADRPADGGAHRGAQVEEGAAERRARASASGIDSFRALRRPTPSGRRCTRRCIGARWRCGAEGSSIPRGSPMGSGARRSGWAYGCTSGPRSNVAGRARRRRVAPRQRDRAPARRRSCSRPAPTPIICCPRITRRFIPLYDYILVSEPLTSAQWETIGWKQAAGDHRRADLLQLLSADRRRPGALGHQRGHLLPAATGWTRPAITRRTTTQTLRASWRRHFPALADLEWPYAWGGPICSTTRLTPFFGRALGGRACYGLGYTGHGLGSTRIAGRILAHMVLDRPSDLLDLPLVTGSGPSPIRRNRCAAGRSAR